MKINWANRITVLRILLIVPFVGFMLKTNDPALAESTQHLMRHVAALIFVVMAISDGVDGYLARKKNLATKLGAFLDPAADKLLMTSALLLLTSQRASVPGFSLPLTVVVLIIGKDLFLLLGFVTIHFLTLQVNVVPAFIGKLATTLQLSMVTGILIAPEVSQFIPGWIWLLRVLWWSAAGTAILATLIYIRTGSRYIEQYEHTIARSNNR